MRVRHEGRKLILHAEELVHRVVVPLPFFALGLHGQEPVEHRGGEPLRGVLFLQRIGVQLRDISAQPIEARLLMRGRRVAQFAVVGW